MKFGLALAFEPKVPTDKFQDYLCGHTTPAKKRAPKDIELACFETIRVLVISFLYGERYYHDLATELFHNRFTFAKKKASLDAHLRLSVHGFYLVP